jgi:hypothetical protein
MLDFRAVVPQRAVEQRMLDPLGIAAAQPEAHVLGDVGRERRNVGLYVVEGEIELRRHVAAGDVEADAADRDVLLIGDDAADRHGVAEVPVRAQHGAGHAADAHAAVHLRQGALVVLTEDFWFHHRNIVERRPRNRHCERSEAIQANARAPGLPRRFAPRNDGEVIARYRKLS